MTFPVHDPYWTEVAEFVHGHLISDSGDILAPEEFRARWPQRVTDYASLSGSTVDGIGWALIHKGMLSRLDRNLVKRVSVRMRPVFANEVFVVFTTDPAIPPMHPGSPHLRVLMRALARRPAVSWKALAERTRGRTRAIAYRLAQKLARAALAGRAHLFDARPDGELGGEGPGGVAAVYLGDFTAVTRTIWGHKLYIDTRDMGVAPHFLLDGFWEMWSSRTFLGLVREGMTVVDIGANIGHYTLLAAWKVGARGRVHAFEISPRLCDLIGRSITVNGFLDRVSIVNKAVWETSGKVLFTASHKHSGANRVIDVQRQGAGQFALRLNALSASAGLREQLEKMQLDIQGGQIDAISLDDYFPDAGATIDVMKIDVQGAEPFVFRGMRNTLQRCRNIAILCEFCPSMIMTLGEDPARFLEELRAYGFTVRVIRHNGRAEEANDGELLSGLVSDLLLRR